MTVSLIWAMSQNRVIGIENRLPWKLPADMAWFRQHTLGKTVVMGRLTYESFGAKPLPQRTNIVISGNADYSPGNVPVVNSVEAALTYEPRSEEIMIIGGASLYTQCLPLAQRLYQTVVQTEITGDAHFPDFDADQWEQVDKQRHERDARNSYDCEFSILQRRVR